MPSNSGGGRSNDMNVVNSYTNSGALNTRLPQRGIDIGPIPDFWADIDQILKRTNRPAVGPTMGQQARAIAQPMPRGGEGRRMGGGGGGPLPAPTARQFARPSMSPQGVLGHYVNPLDVPADLFGRIPTGFFTDDTHSNYTYSPTVDPGRYYQPSSGGKR